MKFGQMIKFSQIALIFILTIAASARESSGHSIINPSKVKPLSWKPRAFVYEGFLTDEECNHLISLAKNGLKRSAVADSESGTSKLSEVRTSSGMFIPKEKVWFFFLFLFSIFYHLILLLISPDTSGCAWVMGISQDRDRDMEEYQGQEHELFPGRG